MNEQTPHTEDRMMKVLAILGFIVLVVFIAWIAIQFIRILPSAFSSLASLADSVYNRHNEVSFDVVADNTTVNSRESNVITWSNTGTPGTYVFMYECTEGVSLDIRTSDGAITPVTCDEAYEIGNGVSNLEVLFASERNRFVDVVYSISFTPADEDGEVRVAQKTLTIVNPRIPLTGVAVVESEPEVDTPVVTGNTLPYTGYEPEYRTVETVTYSTPQSDPQGYTELAVTYKAVGTLSGSTFSPKSTLSNDERGAFQFEVKNTGTKTSDTWTFTATLTSGTVYTSEVQEALKPNEYAIITVAFDGVGKAGMQEFGATIHGGNDQTTSNNSFTKTVAVRN